MVEVVAGVCFICTAVDSYRAYMLYRAHACCLQLTIATTVVKNGLDIIVIVCGLYINQ